MRYIWILGIVPIACGAAFAALVWLVVSLLAWDLSFVPNAILRIFGTFAWLVALVEAVAREKERR